MYAQITANKRKTAILVTLFSIFVVLLFLILGFAMEVDPIASLILGTMFATIYSLISYYTADKVALFANGAKPISKRDHFELYTTVENLAIAGGIPTPNIYIIKDPALNAFATGRSPRNASVAITTGLLEQLDKTELQGVMAHEISHIRNYDIRLMTVVVVMVGLVALVSDIMLRGFMFKGDNKKGNAALVLFLVAIVLGILSPLIAQVIKLAVSRSREYLADASGALLTRHPEGLASALEKISASGTKMKRANHATAHMFISNPYGKQLTPKTPWYQRVFMTHPPAHDRISKLRTMGQ